MGDDSFSTGFRLVAAVIAGFAALVGVLIIVRGLRRGAEVRDLQRTGTRTTGVIVDNQMHSGAEGHMSFSPVVRFTDSSGHGRVASGDERASTSWVAGTTVEVVYDPERPDHLLVGSGGRGSPVGVVVVGAVFLAFAAAVVLGVGATAGWTGGPTVLDLDPGSTGLPPGFDPAQQVDPGK